jgi:hypothetical protein
MGAPDMRQAPEVQARKQELVAEVGVLLDAIRDLAPAGTADPWADAATLARSVTLGLMDAPQLRNNMFGRGEARTRILEGKSVAVDESGHPLTEKERLSKLKKESR